MVCGEHVLERATLYTYVSAVTRSRSGGTATTPTTATARDGGVPAGRPSPPHLSSRSSSPASSATTQSMVRPSHPPVAPRHRFIAPPRVAAATSYTTASRRRRGAPDSAPSTSGAGNGVRGAAVQLIVRTCRWLSRQRTGSIRPRVCRRRLREKRRWPVGVVPLPPDAATAPNAAASALHRPPRPYRGGPLSAIDARRRPRRVRLCRG